MNVTVYDSYDKWLEASTKTPKSYDIADGEAVLIRNTGEMVFSKTAADTLSTNKASLDISYTKTGFTMVNFVRNIITTARILQIRTIS